MKLKSFLYKHPKILDVQVAGVPDEKYGEEAAAWIILNEGASRQQKKKFVNFVKVKFLDYKIPRYIFFVDSYPMTASGKIQKFKLRERFDGC